jgi:hypothetical protein
MRIPFFVIARDRVTQLRKTVEALERAEGIEIILIDNESTHPPTVQYLQQSPHKVIWAGGNYGPAVAWHLNLLPEDGPFGLTDPDVMPVPECPNDWPAQLLGLLARDTKLIKAGLSLRIDNIPEHYFLHEHVRNWEGQFWANVVEEWDNGVKVYAASIDTTLAIYRNCRINGYNPAVRVGWPYTAEHLAWYVDSNNLTEEEIYYREHCNKGVASWRYSEQH